jgi:hypothetical protein
MSAVKPWKSCVALIAAISLFVAAGCAVVTPKQVTPCEM